MSENDFFLFSIILESWEEKYRSCLIIVLINFDILKLLF